MKWLTRPGSSPRPSELTPVDVYRARRHWMSGAVAVGAAASSRSWAAPADTPSGTGQAADGQAETARPADPSGAGAAQGGAPVDAAARAPAPGKRAALKVAVRSADAGEPATAFAEVSTYNNYYEFGTDKAEPARRAKTLQPEPWKLVVEGAVAKPRTFDLDDLRTLAPLEERIYRLRCVEGWSMVVPWIGYSLSVLLKAVQPLGSARFVSFETLADGKQMPELNSGVLRYPYVEGLRLDEAMHPLTLLTLGLYGEVLPNQNGAPLRITIPWKYGFKSGKSVVRLRVLEEQPATTWNVTAPREYGFYANVNPEVDHPRWSQATERRIGSGFFAPRLKTKMFNGYADEVASMYAGMDLRRQF